MSSIQQLNTVEESSNSNNMFDRINQDGDSDSNHKSNSIVDSNTKYANDKYVTKKKDKSKNTNNDIEQAKNSVKKGLKYDDNNKSIKSIKESNSIQKIECEQNSMSNKSD